MKKKRWQIKRGHQSDHTYGVQTSSEAWIAANRRRKKKDSQPDPFGVSEGGELPPGEEVIARLKRQRKTKKRLSDPLRRIYGDGMKEEVSVPALQLHKIFRALPACSSGDGSQAAMESSASLVKEKSKATVSKTQMRSILQTLRGASSPAGKKKGKGIAFKEEQTKSSPSVREINVGALKDSSEEEISGPQGLQHSRKKKREALDADKEEAGESTLEEGTRDLVEKIAHDPGKKEEQQATPPPSYGDLGKIACNAVGKIDYYNNSKQVQEAAEIKALLDMDDQTVSDQIQYYHDQLNCCLPDDDDDFWDECDDDEPQLIEVYQQIALYRIKAHTKADEGVDLDITTLKKEYPETTLQDEDYFQRYECSLGWYFDPARCKIAGLEDYQRLKLHHDGLYEKWGYYQGTYSTYKGDQEYVKFWEEMSKETKWIEDYIFEPEWEKIKRRAYHQYLRIATRFHNILAHIAINGFREHIWNVKYEFSCYKRLYALYLEIWKRVAQQKMSFVDALRGIYDGGMFPSCHHEMKIELENKDPSFNIMKYNYDTYVARIDTELSEDDARPLVIKAVRKMTPKPKIYVDYARKKLAVADTIGLIHRSEKADECVGKLH